MVPFDKAKAFDAGNKFHYLAFGKNQVHLIVEPLAPTKS
jgi:hypothetical protein